MNSIEILKSIYKPYRYTIKGKTTLLETTSGDFIIKEKNKDLKELYNYLDSRNFNNYAKLIDASRSDVNVFEYVNDTKMPLEQKGIDLIDIISNLHNKTSYFKDVSEDKYKSIYEDIKSNINYLTNKYNIMYDKGFNEEFMSPSTYLFMRNYYKLNEILTFASNELDNWYNLVSQEHKVRVSVVHNNLALEHFLKGEKEALISWDNYLIDTPVIDIAKLYKNEWENINFSEVFKRYLYRFPLLEHEKKLLFILISLPININKASDEFGICEELSHLFNYIFKTEELIRPYYLNEQDKENHDF